MTDVPERDVARLRAGTADRERVIEVLKTAFAEGRLTTSELTERVGLAWQSRTFGDLAAVTGDLPAREPADAAAPAAATPDAVVRRGNRQRLNRTAVTALVCSMVPLGATAIAAILLGAAARQEIKESGERGMDVAGAAIALGSLFTVMWMCLAVAVMVLGLHAGGSG